MVRDQPPARLFIAEGEGLALPEGGFLLVAGDAVGAGIVEVAEVHDRPRVPFRAGAFEPGVARGAVRPAGLAFEKHLRVPHHAIGVAPFGASAPPGGGLWGVHLDALA